MACKRTTEQDAEYVQCENLPYGTASDVFSYELLTSLNREITQDEEREHINTKKSLRQKSIVAKGRI